MKNYQSDTNMGFLGWLTLLFVGLKLTGYIGWPWLWVLSPIWVPVVTVIVIATFWVAIEEGIFARSRAFLKGLWKK